jgi:hypothetical protein
MSSDKGTHTQTDARSVFFVPFFAAFDLTRIRAGNQFEGERGREGEQEREDKSERIRESARERPRESKQE